jgi:type IV secretion system protein VirB9
MTISRAWRSRCPLDIVLEAGEQVRQIVDGDRAPAEHGQARRWQVHEGGDGVGDGLRPHVFVTVTEAGLSNGITITTTRWTYYIACKSVAKSPTRVLRWHYAPHPQEPDPVEEPPGILPHPDQPRRYHVGYVTMARHQPPPAWKPRQVVDDGTKLYLIYPEVTLFGTVPLVRALGVHGPQLINARQHLNVVILDQLAPALELRVGVGEAAEVVTITRGPALRTITCPDEGEACPQWPAAARTLARRLP